MNSLKFLIVVNAIALLAGLAAALVEPLFTDLAVRGRYTDLDRQLLVDNDKLADFNEELAEDPRNNVPRWIAGPASASQRRNAWLLVGLSGTNLVGLSLFTLGMRRRKQVEVSPGANV